MNNLKDIIQEKLVITKDTKLMPQYTCHPKDDDELRNIIEKRLKQDEDADLNDIDVSNITDMRRLFNGLDPHNIKINRWDVNNDDENATCGHVYDSYCYLDSDKCSRCDAMKLYEEIIKLKRRINVLKSNYEELSIKYKNCCKELKGMIYSNTVYTNDYVNLVHDACVISHVVELMDVRSFVQKEDTAPSRPDRRPRPHR